MKNSSLFHVSPNSHHSTRSQKRGFTLIELLVIVAILVALAAIVSVRYSRAQQKARDAQRINDLHQIATAMQSYYQAKGKLPDLPVPPPTFPDGGDKWIFLTGSDDVSRELRSHINVKPDPIHNTGTDWWTARPYRYVYSQSLCDPSGTNMEPLCDIVSWRERKDWEGQSDRDLNNYAYCPGESTIPCDLRRQPAIFGRLEVTRVRSVWPNESSWLLIPLSKPLTQ